MVVEGATFGILGALAAFPRRLAMREVAKRGGVIRRGITRRTTHVVFGRTLLDKLADDEIAQRVDAVTATGAIALSENGFRRMLGLLRRPAGANLARQSLLEQSRLDARSLQLLSLFDAFEHDAEPFSFRDVILARTYARLVTSGASWGAIARSVHRAGKVTSLTAVALQAGGADGIYVRDGEALTEIDGQHLLPFEADVDADGLFERAEEAERAGDFAGAAALYAQYLSVDPGDSVAAFNRANALRAAGDMDEAAHAYALAIKRDSSFAEAWFNFGTLLKEMGRLDTARSHLLRATELDAGYADPIYNLGALEYDAGRLDEARSWWGRYLQLDPESEWGKRAARGVHYIDLKLAADRKARKPGKLA